MSSSPESRKRVLLVDDDSLFLSTIADQLTILSEGSWEIVTAESATKALALLQEGHFHLAVVDLQMPVVNGNQFLMLVRHRYPALHKAILTGYATDEERAACLSNGAELCLDKPRSPLELEAVYSALNELAQWQVEEGFRGVLRRVGLEDVLQMECLSHHSAILEVSGPVGGGEIYIQDGRIVHAATGDLQGEDAFNRLLTLRGGEFHLRPFSPPPAETIQTPWEVLLMEAARKRDESAAPPAEAITPSPQPPAPEPAPAPQPQQPAPAPARPIPRIYPAHPASRGETSPFRRTSATTLQSPADIVLAKPVPGLGLDLAPASAIPSRLVRDFTGAPVPLPDPPQAETPVTIQEFMLCDGQGEILSQWQCSGPDRWIQLLEFVSQKSRQLAHGLAAGQVERLVVATSDVKIVLRVGVDYGVVARAIPGLHPQVATPAAAPSISPRAWLENLAPPPNVAGWGLRFSDRTGFTLSFSDRLAVGVLDTGWRTVADLYNVLVAHRIAALQIRWDYELARIHSRRRPDGLIFSLFALRAHDAKCESAIASLLDQFASTPFEQG